MGETLTGHLCQSFALVYSLPNVCLKISFIEIYFIYHKVQLFLKCTIQWFLVYSWNCVTIITV